MSTMDANIITFGNNACLRFGKVQFFAQDLTYVREPASLPGRRYGAPALPLPATGGMKPGTGGYHAEAASRGMSRRNGSCHKLCLCPDELHTPEPRAVHHSAIPRPVARVEAGRRRCLRH